MTHAVLKKGWNESGLNRRAGRSTLATAAGGRQCAARSRAATINSDAAALGRAAAVVGLRGDVGDRPHLEACGLQRTDRGLAT